MLQPKPSRTPRDPFGTSTVKAETGNGGIKVTQAAMQPANKVPCIECPIRRTSVPGYLGGYTPEMYIEVMHSPASLACHMSPGFKDGDVNRQKHCTGVAGYRANVGHICNLHGLPTAAHRSTQLVGHDEAMFFATPEEFIEHHEAGQEHDDD